MGQTAPLVLVVGAGASRELALPTGAELKAQIANDLAFVMDERRQLKSGDRAIHECIYRAAQSGKQAAGTVHDYFRAAETISGAMPLAPSIDNFIDSHKHDRCISEVAKMAIASCILKAESGSALYYDRSNSYNELNFNGITETWLARLFGLISQHCSWDELESRFSQLSIICFNYDRCIEHFFKRALIRYYRLRPDDAERILAKMIIHHPYGFIGQFRPEHGGPGINFGETPTSDSLEIAVNRIKTFTEGTDSASSNIDGIRETIFGAKTVAFLGFAYHPLNLKLLYDGAQKSDSAKETIVIGTAKGISDSDANLISEELCLHGGYAKNAIWLRQDKTAADVLLEYGRKLARSMHSAA